jgi:hypothetical protein
MLRLAETLDRSHSQVVEAVEVEIRRRKAVIRVRARGDAELEIWAASHQLEPFARLVGRDVRVELSQVPALASA